MNDKKFIQLLNLYIDGEATPPEAREVEHEIENNIARRRIYDDYRRIQVATRTLYSQFRRDGDGASSTEAGLTGRIRAAGVRTAAAARPGRASGHPFRRVLFWAGGAAAACLALAASFLSLPRFGGGSQQIQAVETAGVSVPTVEPAATAVAASSSYAAPFAATTRVDPYLAGDALPPGDPFSLAPSQRQNPFGDPELVLKFSPAYAPVSDPSAPLSEADRNRKLQAILRGEVAPAQPQQGQGLFVPVNMRAP
jgi:anti-sigma factor RsiW